MKLGQRVQFSKYYEGVYTWNPGNAHMVKLFGTNEEPDIYKIDRYVETECEPVIGIVTGYKRVSISSRYKISRYKTEEEDMGYWEEVERERADYLDTQKEYVYEVKTTLTKKYYVKKEWLVVV